VLVEENDVAALARAIEQLIAQPARRRMLGVAGQARVRAEFGLEQNLDRLAGKFGLTADAGSHAHRFLRTA
jgi:glycosyltransferase involved in cell wall biosynthesis